VDDLESRSPSDAENVESEWESSTLSTALPADAAEREIAQAVGARHALARRYVVRMRQRRPDASPAEVISMLERHYVAAISVAGGVTTAGAIAASVGLSLIQGASAGTQAGKAGAKVAAKKVAAKAAAKAAARAAAVNVAKSGVARMVPAGDERIQFENTAIFALALAEIHSMRLDQDQSKALVYGLSNDRVSPKQIAAMATDVARTQSASQLGNDLASTQDSSHWADTLADQLPGSAAIDLVRTVRTGQFDAMRSGLSKEQQSAIEYGVGAVAGGVTRFVFGRDVVNAARAAFSEAPMEFPSHLAVEASPPGTEEEPNRALAALDDAARATTSWATAVADKSTRMFRSVDLDGDGIPDEPQALTALKGATDALAGIGTNATRVFRRVDRDGDGVGDDPAALAKLRELRDAAASRAKRPRSTHEDPAEPMTP